jgi:hypothetical protein
MWTGIDCPEQNGVITGYMVEFFKHGTDATRMMVKSTAFTANRLDSGSLYVFRVAAVNEFGVGPFSDFVSLSTPLIGKW